MATLAAAEVDETIFATGNLEKSSRITRICLPLTGPKWSKLTDCQVPDDVGVLVIGVLILGSVILRQLSHSATYSQMMSDMLGNHSVDDIRDNILEAPRWACPCAMARALSMRGSGNHRR